jgi:hypothetical protein
MDYKKFLLTLVFSTALINASNIEEDLLEIILTGEDMSSSSIGSNTKYHN